MCKLEKDKLDMLKLASRSSENILSLLDENSHLMQSKAPVVRSFQVLIFSYSHVVAADKPACERGNVSAA